MNERDYIYYDYRFLGIKPKKIYLKLYCIFRRLITFKESPSKVTLWNFREVTRLDKEYIKK